MKRILVAALAGVLGLATSAGAATFKGEFWNAASGFANVDAAEALTNSRPADATFRAELIDFPNGDAVNSASNGSLSAFLGTAAATLSGESTTSVSSSAFRFFGHLDLAAGPQTFSVGSDDGFRLRVGGDVISQAASPRGFGATNVTVDAGTGPTFFELIYFENGGNSGVEFKIDGAFATAAAVPLPASLPLMLGAFGAAGVALRRRKAARG